MKSTLPALPYIYWLSYVLTPQAMPKLATSYSFSMFMFVGLVKVNQRKGWGKIEKTKEEIQCTDKHGRRLHLISQGDVNREETNTHT